MGMKVFTIINRTEESVFLSHNSCPGTRSDSGDHPTTTILPEALHSIMLPSSHSLLTLASGASQKSRVSDEKTEIELETFTFHIHSSRQTTWKAVKIGQQCPWRIYHQRVSVVLTSCPRSPHYSTLSCGLGFTEPVLCTTSPSSQCSSFPQGYAGLVDAVLLGSSRCVLCMCRCIHHIDIERGLSRNA